jgi:ligand-binding SRPBCC domain-containing protein
MSTFRIVTELAAPVEACFDLSRSIDLHLESMLASDERAVAGVTSGLIGAGEEVTWEARHLGVTWRMTSRIVEFDPPNRFVDEMVRGPFRAFRHEHVFEASGMGTRMVDVITFRTPLAILTERAVGLYLRRLMRVRNAAIQLKAHGARS